MKKALLTIGAVALLVVTYHPHYAQADLTPANIIQETNYYREANYLKPLKENAKLDKAAQLKAEDILAKQYWGHNSPEGKTPWDWIIQAGYNYQTAGENLAVYFTTTPQLMEAWEKSPGHDANLKGKTYTEIGVAVVKGNFKGHETEIIVQIFGQPFIHKASILPKRRRLAILIASGSQAGGVPSADGCADVLGIILGRQRLATQCLS